MHSCIFSFCCLRFFRWNSKTSDISDLLNGNSSCRKLDTVMHKIVRAFFSHAEHNCDCSESLWPTNVIQKWITTGNHSHEFYSFAHGKNHIYMDERAKYIHCQIVWQRNLLRTCRRRRKKEVFRVNKPTYSVGLWFIYVAAVVQFNIGISSTLMSHTKFIRYFLAISHSSGADEQTCTYCSQMMQTNLSCFCLVVSVF